MKTQLLIRSMLIVVLSFGAVSATNAQILKKLKKRAEESAKRTLERKVEEKAEQKTEQAIDSLFEIGKNKKKKKRKKRRKGKSSNSDDMNEMDNPSEMNEMMVDNYVEQVSFEAYSKFDFTPGETIIGLEDFYNDDIGDLPVRWNTNTSAEVVSLNTLEGKWMRIGKGKSAFVADFISEIPDNFTLEFDVIFDYDPTKWAYSRRLGFILSDLENPNHQLDKDQVGRNFFRMNLVGDIGSEYFKVAKNTQLNSSGRYALEKFSKTSTHRGIPIRVSISRQKTRVRVYVDEKKIYDIPRALEKGVVAKTLRLQSHISEDDEYFYISNIRYAVGKPDMRSKLITEGKLVTYGITFDVGSATLKPQSYGTLKKIASILNSNPELQVQIIGHTDADGDANFNMDLSINRALAVEQALINEFQVAEEQLSSDGKGETELLDSGTSIENKAKNRRVEFIKL